METQPTNEGVLILDIPVPHKGYVNLLKRHTEGSIKTLYLVGQDILDILDVPKEIRANDPETTRKLLNGLGFPFGIEILGLDMVGALSSQRIYTVRDEVSRRLRERYFAEAEVTGENAFLRWDASNVISTRPALIEEETSDPFHVGMMKRVRELADNSADWWRQIGVVIVKEGKILMEAYNQAFPTDSKPYIDGNPRDFIQAGTLGFLASTAHGEQTAISKAARRGIALEGADLYLNAFPCPPCAYDMGTAGLSRCFVTGGSAYLDAAEVLIATGIKTVYVNEES